MKHVFDTETMKMRELLNLTKEDTPFQRKIAWKKQEMKERLVNSFLGDSYIPPIVLGKLKNGKYQVLDGLQRLSTFRSYSDAEEHGYDSEKIEELNNKEITIHVISDLTDESARELFLTLNRNSIPLSAPELRRASLFKSPIMKVLNSDLKGEASTIPWAKSFYAINLGDKISQLNQSKRIKKTFETFTLRCKDEDVALTMLAFSEYKGEKLLKNKNDYLDDYVSKKFTDESKDQTPNARQLFNALMDKLEVLSDIIQDIKLPSERNPDLNPKDELRIRITSMACGLYTKKELQHLSPRIRQVVINVALMGDYNLNDHGNITYWNKALQDAYNQLSLLTIDKRTFSEEQKRKK